MSELPMYPVACKALFALGGSQQCSSGVGRHIKNSSPYPWEYCYTLPSEEGTTWHGPPSGAACHPSVWGLPPSDTLRDLGGMWAAATQVSIPGSAH